MIAKSTQTILFIGLAGSLAMTVAPAARAQTSGIPVTGGQATGQAAFFIPQTDPNGNVRLFDIGIQTLQIQTDKGTTTTSVFTPNAATFSDANSNGMPDSGDTGVLRGTLAGTAFTSTGAPILFTGRETLLNFTLDSFDSTSDFGGTLISPQMTGAAPLVFLPIINATLASGSSFDATFGEMQIGDFTAALDNGLIDLPGFLEFRSGGGQMPTLPPIAVGRRIKFEFKGKDVTPVVFNFNANSLRFAGAANDKFEIQTTGRQGSQRFEIKADAGFVDVALGGPFTDLELQNPGAANGPLDYKIEGESNGIFSLYAPNSFAFNGFARRDTKFEFKNDNDFKFEGRSAGSVNFYATAGLGTQVNRDITFTDFTFTNFDGANNPAVCNACNTTLVNNANITIGGQIVTIGQPVVVLAANRNNSVLNQSSSSSISFTNSVSFNSGFSTSIFGNSESSSTIDVFNPSSSGSGRNRYRILSRRSDDIKIKVVNRGNRRYYRVRGRGRRRRGFAQVGPNCRIFPGLVGLRELSEDELNAINIDDTDDTETNPGDDDNSTDDDNGTDDDDQNTGDDDSDNDDGDDDSDNDDGDDDSSDDDGDDDSDNDDGDDDFSDDDGDDDSSDDNDSEDDSSTDDGTTTDDGTSDSSTPDSDSSADGETIEVPGISGLTEIDTEADATETPNDGQ
ncbi:hypothetical protein IQ249_22125 [Lusitaniella coriacea LEGE 07157]|uniref:Uncharacterized protein n=1 Tax=Lusitaniella coriacea LEGE 07157 TaxID=945747 RepID=A0A8J7JF83_9CYAN|nr:hypothetical protein [Lusitaniella coriacea]MBE9118590.1 hypothetical protein [Lusitaniella coriacea LEGE 07157]